MKNLALILISIALSSCLTISKIQKNCDKFSKICVIEIETKTIVEIKDSVVFINDTIPYYLPKDSVLIRDSIRIVDNQATLGPIHKEVGVIGVDAWISDNLLNIDAYLKDSTILIPYQDSIIVSNKTVTKSKDSYIELAPEKFIPGFYKVTFWWSIVTWLLIVVFIIGKYFKFKIPFFS